MNKVNLDDVLESYMTTALWSSNTDEGDAYDEYYTTEDFIECAREEMRIDCKDFLASMVMEGLLELLPHDYAQGDLSGQIGHDFWLTRNGHGVGFWDRGLGEIGDRLTKLAQEWGTSDVYTDYDGTSDKLRVA